MPPVTLHWYDGGLRPPTSELEADGVAMPDEGLLFVGDEGKLLAGFSGREPRLLPKSKMQAFTPPPQSLPRPIGELEQFIRACRGEPAFRCELREVPPFVETILLGTIAVRLTKKLQWDAANARFVDSPEADAPSSPASTARGGRL